MISGNAESRKGSGDMRFDAPHTMTKGDAASTGREGGSPAARPSGGMIEAASLAQQLHTQAVQLADHLSGRQRDLDHREAELNARAAELDASLRRPRLWLAQRKAEVDESRATWEEKRQEEEKALAAERRPGSRANGAGQRGRSPRQRALGNGGKGIGRAAQGPRTGSRAAVPVAAARVGLSHEGPLRERASRRAPWSSAARRSNASWRIASGRARPKSSSVGQELVPARR